MREREREREKERELKGRGIERESGSERHIQFFVKISKTAK